eukprot:1344300-Amorphochlora_amoeboformis.AAC.1
MNRYIERDGQRGRRRKREKKEYETESQSYWGGGKEERNRGGRSSKEKLRMGSVLMVLVCGRRFLRPSCALGKISEICLPFPRTPVYA